MCEYLSVNSRNSCPPTIGDIVISDRRSDSEDNSLSSYRPRGRLPLIRGPHPSLERPGNMPRADAEDVTGHRAEAESRPRPTSLHIPGSLLQGYVARGRSSNLVSHGRNCNSVSFCKVWHFYLLNLQCICLDPCILLHSDHPDWIDVGRHFWAETSCDFSTWCGARVKISSSYTQFV